jgi:acetyl-CoA carboxylase biotin carboxylase subunit
MSAAEIAGVDAIHPGYGFLSENAKFAEICEKYGVKFIGPKSTHIQALGNKVEARAFAEKAGVPMLPGSAGAVTSLAEAEKLAKEIGFPLIIKAAAGGGGRGMKIVRSKDELSKQFDLARSEAQVGFGNPDVFIERYCERPRHVEVQLVADEHGNATHLGERDCSIQRRHQKLLEEAPCPIMTPARRKEIGDIAVRLAKAVGYQSLGTVEFLMDEDGRFYFMEVNTRAQVEHPVTEMITSVDLIKEQINIARGHKLSFDPAKIELRGHALECRINAEDPYNDFRPSPGKIVNLHKPGGHGVRVDSHIYAGYTIPSNYDSMIAKLIVVARTREECIVKMRRALEEFVIEGVHTTIPLQLQLMNNRDFQDGNFTTAFMSSFEIK